MSNYETETTSIQSKASQLYEILVTLREANNAINDLKFHPNFTTHFRGQTLDIITSIFIKLEDLTEDI